MNENFELIEQIEETELKAFCSFCVMPNSKIISLMEYQIIKTGVQASLFNGVFRLRLPENKSEQMIQDWEHYFKEIPFTVFLYPTSSHLKIREQLTKFNFKKLSTSTIVTFDTSLLSLKNQYELPKNCKIKRVDNILDSGLFHDAFTEIFEIPKLVLDFLKDWAIAYGFDSSLPIQSLIITKDEKAIAIASYFKNNNIAMIFNVGVRKENRGQGLGLLISQEISRLSRDQGCKYLFGTGSNEGMRVYRKVPIEELGFSERWIKI